MQKAHVISMCLEIIRNEGDAYCAFFMLFMLVLTATNNAF